MRKTSRSGFTLIEMLVVLAIIGILSSVLLTSLGPAKDRAKDARIVQEINQARTIAETLYLEGNYNALPTQREDIFEHITLGPLAIDIENQGGEMIIRRNQSQYIIYSVLNAKTTPQAGIPEITYYCVDSTGKSGFPTSEPTGFLCVQNQ